MRLRINGYAVNINPKEGTHVTTIRQRYEQIQERIATAAARSGRDANDIHLVAVTKYASVDDVRQLVDLGHVDFAESRLQHFTQIAAQIDEYIDRRKELGEPDLASPIRWHFIGHLQRDAGDCHHRYSI